MHKLYLSATLVYLAFLTSIVILANNEWASWLFNIFEGLPYADKLGHLFLMGIFSFLLNSALRCREITIRGIKILLGSLIVCGIVLAEEVSQVFVESRNSDPLDMLFDVMGIYLFGLLARRLGDTAVKSV